MFAPVPVFVVAGPQGVGKTTMLNHLLRHSADTRIGVVLNDFGDVEIDGLLVTGQAGAALAVSGGCLRCAEDNTEVAGHLVRLTAPRAGLDAVLVEASGLADPAALACQMTPRLGRGPALGALIAVVDAADPDPAGAAALEDRVAPADLVVLAKADRVAPESLTQVKERVRAAVSGRPVVEARHGALDPALLFDLRHDPTRQLTLGDLRADEHTHLHAPHRTVAWREERTLHPRRLAHLLGEGVPEAFRIKGLVEIEIAGLPRRWTVHRVGRHVRVTPAAPGRRRGSRLTLLGPELDGGAYDALRATVVESGEEADAHDLAELERFVPRRQRLSPTLLALDAERELGEGA